MEGQCYAKRLGNCNGPISDEHYISESVLKLLAVRGGLFVDRKKLDIEEVFHAKILCKYHNENLSLLATQALSFFKSSSPR